MFIRTTCSIIFLMLFINVDPMNVTSDVNDELIESTTLYVNDASIESTTLLARLNVSEELPTINNTNANELNQTVTEITNYQIKAVPKLDADTTISPTAEKSKADVQGMIDEENAINPNITLDDVNDEQFSGHSPLLKQDDDELPKTSADLQENVTSTTSVVLPMLESAVTTINAVSEGSADKVNLALTVTFAAIVLVALIALIFISFRMKNVKKKFGGSCVCCKKNKSDIVETESEKKPTRYVRRDAQVI